MSAICEHLLDNGMTLLCWHQPHLHGIEFGLYLKGGPVYETEESQGVSHLLEHLCFRGLGGLDHDQLQRTLNRFGAEMDGMTAAEAIVFRMTVLPRFFDGALDLFTRFFARTPWTAEQIAREKQVVLRQIEQEEDDFDAAVDAAWRETPTGAFPRMGTAESIASMDEFTIFNWQQLIFQPQNACLVLTGNFSDGMEDAAIEAFSELTNYTDEPPFEQPLPLGFTLRDGESDLVWDEEGGQASVHLAFDIDPDAVNPLAAQVLDMVTGGSCDSLLFQALREEEGLVAEIESFLQETGAFRRLVIRWDVRQEYLVESLRKVFAYLRRLTVYIRPVRLEQARAMFLTANTLVQDSVGEMNELAGWAWVSGDTSAADLDAQHIQLADMTPEDLLDAAQTILKPGNLTISVKRDPAIVTGDLAPLLASLRDVL
ncbi:MAG: insulinase family protein [Clostridia bacterium]|nr:insulinase family protein [Clostridia bacterium]